MKNERNHSSNGDGVIKLLLSLNNWESFFREDASKYSIRSSALGYEIFIDIYQARVESNRLLNVKVTGLIELVEKVIENHPAFILMSVIENGDDFRYVYTDVNCTILYGII
jgi:hypothetical protein